MSCLDVMYQVYPPPQSYFAATYSPYHQKLAFYSKMQEAQETISAGSSFSNLSAPTIKEEDCAREKDHPPEAEYINSRCVLFTYFQGDISSVVDEHFSRALSQASNYAPSPASNKSARSASSWKDGSFPMSQRSFPPSFWNSAYQPSVTASLSSALGASHAELPFPADPYSTASLHGHLHQATTEPWHPTHPHHHPPYSLGGAIGTQGSTYPRPSVHDMYGTHFDPRYGSLLVPSVRPHRLPPTTVPVPGPSPCDIGKSEPASSSWTGAFPGTGSDMGQGLGLNVDAGLQSQDKSKDLYWF
ncbi:transcription cofactor vestigial-like protein 2a isoform X1 [Electrophorus electricus]|uniref:transcription cofactor vestigial-like protein 2a isoform X1 n=1 Tax=Electrophorus electricus TaxID=8005 RepID=UPI0015D01913|nr:transcription cofactor vestigial-like protein 2a isoform X1 [Electrophorus electricus]